MVLFAITIVCFWRGGSVIFTFTVFLSFKDELQKLVQLGTRPWLLCWVRCGLFSCALSELLRCPAPCGDAFRGSA